MEFEIDIAKSETDTQTERRSCMVWARVTPTEWKSAARAARQRGITLSDLIRAALGLRMTLTDGPGPPRLRNRAGKPSKTKALV